MKLNKISETSGLILLLNIKIFIIYISKNLIQKIYISINIIIN